MMREEEKRQREGKRQKGRETREEKNEDSKLCIVNTVYIIHMCMYVYCNLRILPEKSQGLGYPCIRRIPKRSPWTDQRTSFVQCIRVAMCLGGSLI